MKVRTLRFSAIKPKLIVAFSICSAGSFNQFLLQNLDKSEIKFLNENLPKRLAG